ncbi:MAG TPA: hypothetical protein VNO30_38820 [Kofleriaceae bacterium]|nr:hypothetical protein [Kofleriaceae bacterium]
MVTPLGQRWRRTRRRGQGGAVFAVLVAVAAAGAGACQGRKQSDGGGGGARPVDAGAGGGAGGGGSAAGGGGSGAGDSGAGADGVGADGSGGGSAGAGTGTGKAAPDDSDAPADPSKQIAELGAIPAWQAVVDRAQLLARRGQKGVVYGRIGPAVVLPAPAPAPAPASAPAPAPASAGAPATADGGIASDAGAPAPAAPAASPYVWLVDDTEGNGALGIRLALGKLQAAAGDRIAVSGAWELDAERHWYWKAAALQPLAPAPPATTYPSTNVPIDPPPPAPSHTPTTGGFPPNVRLIKQAKDNDAVYFQLSGPVPAREGDGWQIAGQLGEPPTALLILPGERPSYGGQDMRSSDERWQLKRQQTYWVRIGKVRPQGAGKPFLVNARTAPIRVM